MERASLRLHYRGSNCRINAIIVSPLQCLESTALIVGLMAGSRRNWYSVTQLPRRSSEESRLLWEGLAVGMPRLRGRHAGTQASTYPTLVCWLLGWIATPHSLANDVNIRHQFAELHSNHPVYSCFLLYFSADPWRLLLLSWVIPKSTVYPRRWKKTLPAVQHQQHQHHPDKWICPYVHSIRMHA